MPWFKVDDGFHGHPKVVELSLSAVGLWTLAGSWCAKYLTDGAIGEQTVIRLGATPAHAAELVAVHLWDTVLGGYEFEDWADYQPLKADVEAERRAAQERMRGVRAKKKGVPNTDGSGELHPNFAGTSPDVRVTPSQSHPSPIPTTPTGLRAQKQGTRITEDFTVSPEMVAWAKTEAPLVDGKRATAMFINHFMAKTGRDATKSDWVRTWKNWLLKDQGYAEQRTTKQTPEQRARQTLALASELDLKGIGA